MVGSEVRSRLPSSYPLRSFTILHLAFLFSVPHLPLILQYRISPPLNSFSFSPLLFPIEFAFYLHTEYDFSL